MSLTNPDALFLLLLIPIFMRLGWPRLAYRRRRDTIALMIRIVLVLLIIFSLAGLQIRREADKLAVVFLLDYSDSMDQTSQDQATAYVRASIEQMGDNDQAAVIIFGENALVEHPMDDLINIRQIGSDPIRLNTDLAEAIRLGLALFPPDTAKRMVILSDGLETVGDAEEAAELARVTDVQIEYVPFGIVRDREVLVNSVRVPSIVGEDEPFDLVVSIENRGSAITTAQLFILADNTLIHDDVVDLRPGTNRYAVGPLQFPSARSVGFRVRIEPLTAEGFAQNNELSAFTQVSGRPRILMVANEPAETQFLEQALTDAGLLIDFMTPEQMPFGLAPLTSYRSIILANVNAVDLTPDRMDLIETYVKDLGGGLVVVGGPDSYGVGGYFETPLERTLPVEMRIRDEERIPKLAMVYVIDRSGSMEASGPSGFTNLDLAKEAVLRSMNFLNDYDRAGVVSFDTDAFWVVPIQDIGDSGNRRRMEANVASLRPGGGTDIFGGLQAVDQVLPDDPATLKHVILLTDGGANPQGILPLVQRMFNTHDITTSVVAVGDGYAPWLRNVAADAGGNFNIATTVESIPAIFSQETVLATRSYIFEESFRPALSGISPIVDNVDLGTMPELLGYVATSPKETATIIMTGPEDDPILAAWQYGLGRSVAFTSDATQRWGTNWVNNWTDFTRLWNQAVRWTITEGTASNLDTWVEHRGEQAVLIVDARDNEGNYLNALNLNASVVFPDRESVSPRFRQVAPGRYEATFQPDQEGAYFINVYGNTMEGAAVRASVAERTGWVLSYSSEYRVNEPNVRFLRQLANETGGGSLAGEPAAAFEHNLDQEEAAMPLWPYLMGFAAFLLLVDIGIRRLVIRRSDLQRLREVVFGKRELDYETTETSERMTGLMGAKQRAGAALRTSQEAETPQEPKPPDTSKPPRVRKRQAQAPSQQPESSVTSRLLQKKRERSGGQD